MHHASSRLRKPVPSALWSTDHHSPFVRDADRKFSFLWCGGENKREEKRRKRNSNAGRKKKNGKRRREKGDKDFENDGHTSSKRHMRLYWNDELNKNRLGRASHVSKIFQNKRKVHIFLIDMAIRPNRNDTLVTVRESLQLILENKGISYKKSCYMKICTINTKMIKAITPLFDRVTNTKFQNVRSVFLRGCLAWLIKPWLTEAKYLR